MIFQRDYAVINGDNIYGLQLLQEAKVVDLLISELPSKVEGKWKRSIEKRVKLANKISSHIGAFAFFVPSEHVETATEVFNTIIGEENFVVSCEWGDETLIIFGKANVYSEERIDLFLEQIEGMNRFDFRKSKKMEMTKVRNAGFIKEIIRAFADDDAEILDMYSKDGVVGQAVWQLNYEDQGTRKFTLMNKDEHCSNILYPQIRKQSLIYENSIDYIILDDNDIQTMSSI